MRSVKSRKTTRKTSSTNAIGDPTTQYALDVAAGRIVAGPHVRHACRRHLDDLKNGPKRRLKWDIAAAKWTMDFFRQVLRLAGGAHEGKPFELKDSQAFIIGSLFGWKRANGTRRFRTAYLEIGKGNGKSPLSAGVGLFMITADGEPRAQGYAIAAKKDQAQVSFRHAVAMVKQSPALVKRIKLSGGAGLEWNAAHLESGSFFRPIATEDTGSGQSGPEPHFNGIDELHEHKSNAALEFSKAGVKGRRQPMNFITTNSGFDRTSVCWEQHEYACKVAAQELEDDAYFSYVCGLDEDDDPFTDESCWIKANPLINDLDLWDYLRTQVREALGMPGKESLVRRLNFCEWVDADSPWIQGDKWRAAEEPQERFDTRFPLIVRQKKRCFLGLDLSEKNDLTALGHVWPDDNGGFDALMKFWTPKDTIEQRELKDRVPYAAWVKAQELDAAPGPTIDYEFVASYIAQLLETHDVQGLAFDQWHIASLRKEFDRIGVQNHVHGTDEREIGLKLVRHGQGFMGGASEHTLWMERSIAALEAAVLKGTLRVRFSPVLRWNSASAKQTQDAQGNRVWNKRKSTGRIDGIVALCMAVGLAENPPAAAPKPKIRFTVVG
jgi:phage terminase large subunit-like protein